MSMELKARDLLAAGWTEGPWLGEALRRGRALEAEGLSREAMLERLAEEHPREPVRLEPREAPAPLTEAIRAESPEEELNVAAVRRQMQQLLRWPVMERGAVMPDACPSGAGEAVIPVGGAVAVANGIVPGAHSADICCSLWASFFPVRHPVGNILDHLQAVTHFGAGGRPRGQQWNHAVLQEPVWENPFLSGLQSIAREHLGTQGDGNHFAYVGEVALTDEARARLAAAGHAPAAEALARNDGRWRVLVTHHGSRGLGAKVYARGQHAAEQWCRRHVREVPPAAAWLPADTAAGIAYWEALQYVARWTEVNHRLIHQALLDRLGETAVWEMGNQHNFVWQRPGGIYLHGKGATPAWRDAQGQPLLGLIPLNMAREILLVLGNDQADFLSVCPHGAGRNRSRTATLRPFLDAEGEADPGRIQAALAEATAGLDIRWYAGRPDISESPLGYKDATAVRAQIADFGLATVVAEIQPRGCIMAGQPTEPAWARHRRAKHERRRDDRRAQQRELAAETTDPAPS